MFSLSQLAIDLDLEAMEAHLAADSDSSFELARKFYTEGAHSMSIATVTLAQPLAKALPRGLQLIGEDEYNHDVVGTLYQDAYAGNKIIFFEYKVTENQTKLCRVGARPIGDQIINGCLTRMGTVTAVSTDEVLAYQYDPFADNNNGRTMQSFSLTAKSKMYECKNCPHENFLKVREMTESMGPWAWARKAGTDQSNKLDSCLVKFRDYYGQSNYANEWVTAAFDGRKTEFKNGNSDFGLHGLAGRSEAIKKGAAYMGIWMSVIGQMEESLTECKESNICTTDNCNDEAVQKWDEAVALYTGAGHGLHTLADKQCINFRTCGTQQDNDAGTSAVNLEILSLFRAGQLYISNGVCGSLRAHKERIVQLMTVPLIQGSLYYAYINDRQGDAGEKDQGAGAAFAASVLPMICDTEDAIEIWGNTAVGGSVGNTDFVNVKSAFERNYACLGITCDDVGGIFDDTTRRYYEDAYPCTTSSSSSNDAMKAGAIAGAIIGALVVIFLITCYCIPLRRRKMIIKRDMPPAPESKDDETVVASDATADEADTITLYSSGVKGLVSVYDNVAPPSHHAVV